MKFLPKILFILFLTITAQLSAQNDTPLYQLSDKKIDIEFTTAYTFADLVQLKKELAQQQLLLSYQSLQFTEDGKLKQISATLETPQQQVLSFTSRELQLADKPGFHLDADRVEFRGSK